MNFHAHGRGGKATAMSVLISPAVAVRGPVTQGRRCAMRAQWKEARDKSQRCGSRHIINEQVGTGRHCGLSLRPCSALGEGDLSSYLLWHLTEGFMATFKPQMADSSSVFPFYFSCTKLFLFLE